MQSTVLYYKGGTLSEERFRNLTPSQWLFHYREVLKLRARELDYQDGLFQTLSDRLELLWLVVNPEMGKKLIDLKNQSKMNTDPEKEVTAANFSTAWADIIKTIPEEISVNEVTQHRKPVLPTFSRERLRQRTMGITIGRKDEDA